MKIIFNIVIILFLSVGYSQSDTLAISGTVMKIWKKKHGKVLAMEVLNDKNEKIKICNINSKLNVEMNQRVKIRYRVECIDSKCKTIQNDYVK